MKLNISGYSTALFATWWFIEELGLLFDAGDGVSAMLMQKSRKIKHVFISHADRDHLTGLTQLTQLNSWNGFPYIYYPRDCGSFPRMEEFLGKFDPHIGQSTWKGIGFGEEIKIKKDHIVRAFRNEHVNVATDRVKSLSFVVERIKSKLKPEFANLPGKEIGRLRKEKGNAAILDEVRERILGFSGDTPVRDWERWEGVQTLIHEATFLAKEDSGEAKRERNLHSYLPEVLEMATNLKLENLILGHFSSRYSDEQIDEAIKKGAKHFGLKTNIYRVLPGRFMKNVLTQQATYSPAELAIEK